jgi:hypothetical protein
MFVSDQDIKGQVIYIPHGRGEKRLQAALLQYYQKQNTKIITDCLRDRRRNDLLRQIRRPQHTPGPVNSTADWDI